MYELPPDERLGDEELGEYERLGEDEPEELGAYERLGADGRFDDEGVTVRYVGPLALGEVARLGELLRVAELDGERGLGLVPTVVGARRVTVAVGARRDVGGA